MASHQTSDPAGRILAWALPIAGISFAAGFFGPILLSTSNLGPLLGIFVTGPLGLLAGVSVGALRVARDALRLSVALMVSVWVATLLYTLFMIGIAPQAAIVAIPVQCLLIASTAFLLAARSTRSRLRDDQKRLGLIAVVTQVIVLATKLFPPVIKPWWIPAAQQVSAPIPSFAFILDSRFDAGMHFPSLAVNRASLTLAWMITIVSAVCLGLLTRRG